MDLQGAQQTWQVLSNALAEIYNRNASQLSFEELYRNAYNLVLHKHGSFLYECVSEKISQHLQETVQSIVSDTAAMGDGSDYMHSVGGVGASTQASFMLDRMTITWQEHLITMTMIRDILMYMDRTYVQQARRRPVYELGLHLFRVTVWDHPLIGPRVVHLVLQAIKEERTHYHNTSSFSSFASATAGSAAVGSAAAAVAAANAEDSTTTATTASGGGGGGGMTDDHDRTAKVKQVLQMLQLLSRADASYTTNVYQDFEQVFLATTQEFYHNESLDYLSNNSASAYVNKASLRLQQEKERAQALSLPYSTEGPLLQIVQTEFIERHAKTLVDLVIRPIINCWKCNKCMICLSACRVPSIIYAMPWPIASRRMASN
jgi:cullin 3